MNFMLSVYGAPYVSQAPQTALSFAKAAIAEGHALPRVFFYSHGVHIASGLSHIPQGEICLRTQWIDFAEKNRTELVVCITAALRYGLLSEEEAKRISLNHWNVEPPFILSGLGQMIEGLNGVDRHMVFGD